MGLRIHNDAGSTSDAQETYSEFNTHINSSMLLHNSEKLNVRCETNLYNIYRANAETDLRVSNDSYWNNGGKVSPTTEPRSTDLGDPGNSALLAGADIVFKKSYPLILVLTQVIFWCILVIT